MDGWWRRDPFFIRYMAREATAVFVVLYAVILLVGVARLAQGEASFNAWVAGLRGGAGIALHVAILVAFLYHTLSWFQIMPKTMAPIVVGGSKVPATAITLGGLAASALASAILFIVVRAIAS
jgi:fumarate reductase subunit C